MKKLHRYLGVVMAMFWLAQAITGVILVFRWELDDAAVSGPRAAADPAALGARIETLARQGGAVDSMWSNSMAADRFDIYYMDTAGVEHVVRTDGAGQPLRDRSGSGWFEQGAIYDSLTRFHHSLFAGSAGVWIIGLSGLLLLTNLIFGLRLALPRLQMWRRALLTKPAGSGHARIYGWHRVVGLWGAVPAIVIVTAGVLIVLVDEFGESLGGDVPTPVATVTATARVIDAGQAMTTALAQFPGATISALGMPNEGEPWYRVRVRAPGDISRMWGTTTVFVGAADGQIISAHPAQTASVGRRFVEFIYPLHTGQIGGTAMRVVLVLVGVWLATMVVLGAKLWLSRRARVPLPAV